MADGYDTRRLDALSAAMLETATERYPREIKKFLRTEGTKAARVLRAEIKATTKRRTGALSKGVKRGKVWKDGTTWKVRAYNTAPHSTPVNQGHRARDKRTFVQGAGFFARANATMEREVVGDVEAFIDDMLERGLAL